MNAVATPRRVLAAGALAVILAGALPAMLERSAAAPLAEPLARCRGSTRAHVRISWPTAADRVINRRLRFGHHLPKAIRRWTYLVVPMVREEGIDPYLVAAVIRVESDGDPLAWNLDSDARGLMQVLHASFEPAVNLRLGVSMLAALLREFGSRDLALAGYNAGAESVRAYGGIPPFTETRDYVVLVDYNRDLYAGVHLSAARTLRYRQALADLIAFHRRICGR